MLSWCEVVFCRVLDCASVFVAQEVGVGGWEIRKGIVGAQNRSRNRREYALRRVAEGGAWRAAGGFNVSRPRPFPSFSPFPPPTAETHDNPAMSQRRSGGIQFNLRRGIGRTCINTAKAPQRAHHRPSSSSRCSAYWNRTSGYVHVYLLVRCIGAVTACTGCPCACLVDQGRRLVLIGSPVNNKLPSCLPTNHHPSEEYLHVLNRSLGPTPSTQQVLIRVPRSTQQHPIWRRVQFTGAEPSKR